MDIQQDGSVILTKSEWEQWDHLVSEMTHMMDKARGSFIVSEDPHELESFLDQ